MAADEIIDFRGERGRHRYFVGREDMLAEIDRALFEGPSDAQWVLVTGNPGMGKSALLSAYVARVKERGGGEPPHHFLRRGISDWDRPDAVVRSLAAQVEALFPEQSDAKAAPEMRLWRRLMDVSEKVLAPTGQRLVLVVDGLDEVQGSEGAANPLPLFLPSSLPRGVVVLCASRPVYPHLEWLESQENVYPIDLGDERWLASNERACRELLRKRAAELKPALEPAFIEAAATRAEGNLLYADRLVEWLRSQPVDRRRVELLPRGIEAFLTQVWERLRALPQDELEQAARGLGVLCAAREALPLSVLGAAAGWPASDWETRERFLRAARALLLKEEAAPGSDEEEAYRPYHESFRAFVAKKLGPEVMRGHHAALLDTVAVWPERENSGAFERRYALRHALAHAVSAKAWGKARALATDVGFLEAACKEAGTWALENALRGVVSALSDVDEESATEISDVQWAVRAESHWLGEKPEALPRLIYNRLVCVAWEPSRVAECFRFSDGLPTYRLRRPVRMADEVERTLVGHAEGVNACAIAPDGRRMVSASNDLTLKVWDLDSGQIMHSLAGHSCSISACAITPDGRRMVSASWDRTLKVWDLESGRLLRSLEGHFWWVTACAITPDGRRIVSASRDETLMVWDFDSGQILRSFEGHSQLVAACAITTDGCHLVSASWDRTLKVWDLESGRLLRSLEGHSWWVVACAITPDGRHIVSASYDRTLKVWNLDSGQLLRSLNGHSDRVAACAITPDGRRIVSASDDRTLKVWDLESGRLLRSLKGHSSRIKACAITPDGRRIVSASSDQTLKVWNLDSGRFLRSSEGHSLLIKACAITPDGRHIVSASWDKTLKVWDLDSGRLLHSLEGHSWWVTTCAVTPDGRRIVSASWNGTLKVWDLHSGQLQRSIEVHSNDVMACAITPDGCRIISASGDQTLKVWDLHSGQLQSSLEGHSSWINACTIMPDGRHVVSASDDHTLKTWDFDSGRLQSSLEGHSDKVTACAISPDGRCIVSASDDQTLKVWDLQSGRLLRSHEGHSGPVKACAITPDGCRIVSASSDRTLKVWDMATGACETTIYGVATFYCVALTSSVLCAGDELGNLWVLETTSFQAPLSKTSTPRPLRLFCSYSQADKKLRDELDAHLALMKHQGILETWHDRCIEPGADRADTIDRNLEEADIILLLVSADFIASRHCYEKEMRVALDRHHTNRARVIPVILRPVHLAEAPFLKLQALPTNLEPVTSNRWSSRDEAWADVVRGIRLAAKSLRALTGDR